MSTAYELRGRTAQKQRTRDALLAAARQLISDGETPTVEATADSASISRTTAYRYFPNRRALLAAAFPETEMISLMPPNAPVDPVERVALAVSTYLKQLLAAETQQRTMLRLSLEENAPARELPLRQGRAIAWFTDALEPARPLLGDDGLRKLVLSIRTAVGPEALIWLVDVAGLSRREAVAQMKWTAETLCAAALSGTSARTGRGARTS
jgi:AcrR family transcriptional regulator